MINKINWIRNFGVFKNFEWDADVLHLFKKRNLIYGWNYSGKTTLSKLFSNLEKRQPKYFGNAEYSLEIKSNNGERSLNHQKLDVFPYTVKVFNSCYIKSVFSWDADESKEEFGAIHFYLADDAHDTQTKINFYSQRWNPIFEKIKSDNQRVVSEFDEYSKDNGRFAKQATEIRNYLNNQILSHEFNKGHFIKLVEEVKNQLHGYILSQEEVSQKNQASTAINEHITLDANYVLTESLQVIGAKIKILLENTAPQSSPFPELDKYSDLFDWVQTGLNLHKESPKCKFCGNDLKEERILSLNN